MLLSVMKDVASITSGETSVDPSWSGLVLRDPVTADEIPVTTTCAPPSVSSTMKRASVRVLSNTYVVRGRGSATAGGVAASGALSAGWAFVVASSWGGVVASGALSSAGGVVGAAQPTKAIPARSKINHPPTKKRFTMPAVHESCLCHI